MEKSKMAPNIGTRMSVHPFQEQHWTLYLFQLILIISLVVIGLSFSSAHDEEYNQVLYRSFVIPVKADLNAAEVNPDTSDRPNTPTFGTNDQGGFNFPASIIFSPMARLYSGDNLTGNYFDYSADEASTCERINGFFRGQIRSLETYGTCIRLYTGFACDGDSLAIYPRISDNSRNILEIHQTFSLKDVKSVGTCFENELNQTRIETEFQRLEGSTVSSNSSDNSSRLEKVELYKFQKLKVSGDHLFVPDRLLLDQDSQSVGTWGTPIYWYKTGNQGRLEYLRAFIEYKHIAFQFDANFTTESPHHPDISLETAPPSGNEVGYPESDIDWYQKPSSFPDRKESDVMGRFMGLALGPQKEKDRPQDLHNVFPQTVWNSEKLSERENWIVKYLKNNPKKIVGLSVNVEYENENGTRPIGFSHVIKFNGESTSRVYLTNLI